MKEEREGEVEEKGRGRREESCCCCCCFFLQAEDGIRDSPVTGVQTCALPISFWHGEQLLMTFGRGEHAQKELLAW